MLRAVILDANAVARNLLTSVLNNGGHEVVGDANLAPASLARIIKLKPQIICIDVGEVAADGMAVIDQLRGELPKALLFMVSSKIDASILQAAQERGVHGFIVKPFNSVAVLTAIRNTIVRIAKQQRAAMVAPLAADAPDNAGAVQ
ncbi:MULTISPECIES: ANTAR domain-containing response regulator [unclassified Undibacterium]|uniref:ANTAR domain-containing response regulator n=1 Tax=unclassified Undibacterium TaxID=2630295 RepID=UPI002AC9DA54|nr:MULTISPECIES: response regulator [unclassified Undibacterium]MEB0138858.1 response regulator [Undibacterium sp. CCC2.1]MEB0172280.1 response regulator [Undibacterium sp. CCC1.1]MEB0176103.1 response regulator [Undibacterium sp. CCC3.4]MEB0215936.1 response regulator [Undibacterium sp. 5I2]WPX44756.1 response regulator [Undibacterium sp. CCC3.4]